jgi:uncharacterized protein YbjT (DUF2867 family)
VNYFVTGATGFIGSRVTDKLLAKGHTVTALVRSEAKAKFIEEMGARITVGDLSDKEPGMSFE